MDIVAACLIIFMSIMLTEGCKNSIIIVVAKNSHGVHQRNLRFVMQEMSQLFSQEIGQCMAETLTQNQELMKPIEMKVSYKKYIEDWPEKPTEAQLAQIEHCKYHVAICDSIKDCIIEDVAEKDKKKRASISSWYNKRLESREKWKETHPIETSFIERLIKFFYHAMKDKIEGNGEDSEGKRWAGHTWEGRSRGNHKWSYVGWHQRLQYDTGKHHSGTKTPHRGTKTRHSGTKTPHSGTKTPHSGTKTRHSGTKTRHNKSYHRRSG